MARLKLLIVDDEAKLVESYQQFFEVAGFEVRVTTRGEEALQLVEQHQPDVVLLDWRLEGSKVQGLEVLQRTKELFPHTVVLLYSGYGGTEKTEALKRGADQFLEKPLQLPQLVEAINAALNQRSKDPSG